MGGAMRQAGIVAAAGVYALDHNVERLADDHARARRLGEALHEAGVPVDLEQVETNFVQVDVGPLGLTRAGGDGADEGGGRAALDDRVADEAARGDAPRRRRRRHRRRDRRDPARARSPCPRLTSSPPSSARLLAESSRSKRLPSSPAPSCAAARCSGPTPSASPTRRPARRRRPTTSTASARSRRRSPPSPSCSSATTGKLDLEDRLDAHLDVPARGDLTLRRMLSHGSGLQREMPGRRVGDARVPEVDGRAARDARRGGAGARARRAVALLEPRVHPARRGRREAERHAVRGLRRGSGSCSRSGSRARASRPRRRRPSRTRSSRTATSCSASRCSSSARAASPRPASSGRPSATSAAGRRSSRRPDPDVLAPESLELMTSVQTMADPYRWSLAWGVGLMLVRERRPHLLRARRRDARLPRERARRPRQRPRRRGARERVEREPGGGLARARRQGARAASRPKRRRGGPSAPPPDDLASALGRWWSEGAEFVFRWHDGRLESRWAGARRSGCRGRASSALEGDRFRTVFGRERGELLELVRDGDGRVTRMYWATYPFDREHRVTGAT